ncbi:MAG: FAD-binding protein [candidate division WOR-3 bacterium]
MYDVVIVGAGPSGSTVARLIGNKYKVLLIEKRELIEPMKKDLSSTKSCGGLLSPVTQKIFGRLGFSLPKDVLVEPQLFAVRVIDSARKIERYYERTYINLDRSKFDEWLASMIPLNVEVKFGCKFESYERKDDHLLIKFSDKRNTYIDKTKVLVGADGASSLIRRQVTPKRYLPKTYFAAQEWVKCKNPILPFFSVIFDPEITDYYSWVIPKGEFLIIGAALNPNDKAPGKFLLLKEKLEDFGYRFGDPVKREGAFIFRPLKTKQLSTGEKGVALVGEAGGWISPCSGEGLSYAFGTAVVLSEVLQESLENFEVRYKRRLRKLKRSILSKNIKSHFIFNPFLRKILMKTGIKSIKLYLNPQESSPEIFT